MNIIDQPVSRRRRWHESCAVSVWWDWPTPDVDLHRELLDRVDGRCGGPGGCWVKMWIEDPHSGQTWNLHGETMPIELRRHQKYKNWSWDILAIHVWIERISRFSTEILNIRSALVFDPRGKPPEDPKERTLPGMGGAAPCTASALFLVRHLTWDMGHGGVIGGVGPKRMGTTERCLIKENVVGSNKSRILILENKLCSRMF